jgi:hypothetical protein
MRTAQGEQVSAGRRRAPPPLTLANAGAEVASADACLRCNATVGPHATVGSRVARGIKARSHVVIGGVSGLSNGGLHAALAVCGGQRPGTPGRVEPAL